MVLSTARQYGMSAPHPISMTDINSYCEFERISDPDEREEFLHHIAKMDLVFLADWRAKNPTKGGRRERRGPQGGNFQ